MKWWLWRQLCLSWFENIIQCTHILKHWMTPVSLYIFFPCQLRIQEQFAKKGLVVTCTRATDNCCFCMGCWGVNPKLHKHWVGALTELQLQPPFSSCDPEVGQTEGTALTKQEALSLSYIPEPQLSFLKPNWLVEMEFSWSFSTHYLTLSWLFLFRIRNSYFSETFSFLLIGIFFSSFVFDRTPLWRPG